MYIVKYKWVHSSGKWWCGTKDLCWQFRGTR